MKYLSREDIVAALQGLSAELEDDDEHHLVIAGGAAMVLLYGARESTKDVDVVRVDQTVRNAAERIASQHDLPSDWLNDGAKGYAHGMSLGEAVFRTENLIVRTLAPPQLLAMKLSAWRDDLDIDDARLLLPRSTEAKTKCGERSSRF